ncbi:hypothetical protein HL653_08165 [Sphingomonas sp. AP4-R1]|uniref:glycosyl hydrolase 115 family protein n=1 Tax=Sphingomonas sp. AP4-R1 TaxID=2735134 RepID=UPI0014935382|nr:glycosyl hydrolase 115 family protein [Sphingomonas sp. AP4-R1]QJU57766.1 hypothetical protein HL653_08165 [Sphingomonas sp. AP4-R1]
MLANAGTVAPIVTDPADAAVVGHAAADLADDLALVTGHRPDILTTLPAGGMPILLGTLGHSASIDRLVAAGKLDVRQLKGAWESFLIATVRRPLPGVEQALVIVGSDRRGTAYGAYELSQAIGVSPWVWWADVAPRHRDSLIIASGTRRFGPPSVRYRGIFLNDEDWGLIPWASRTHDPARGNIGPKTYERIFQLLLRLKANTLWPAMHHSSTPFNDDPANARLADSYAIVMSSSHAEPMLRNNVGEWKDAPDRFNYATNPAGVSAYWKERATANAAYENLWPIGMRGIHDSGLLGAATDDEKVALLTKIFADQRALLAQAIGRDPNRIPQTFTPYKEVLDVYRHGLKVPEDVTLIWPDDNFGYIRHFPNASEQARPGGNGVYYHLSYLGAPLSYLWLSTTPPALVQEEMLRAYDNGIRTVWIANVGDIKPAEIDISLFLGMAWDIGAARGRTQRAFLDQWAGATFGASQGKAIGGLLDDYYRLNYVRRPEHLQWWLPSEKPRFSAWSGTEIDTRLARFDALTQATGAVEASIPADLKDAFFELVDYPVRASALANRRLFASERYAQLIDAHPAEARVAAGIARDADAGIKALTRRFNDQVAGGKWRYIMAEEPADNQWRGFRLAPVALPAEGLAGTAPWPAATPAVDAPIIIEAETAATPRGWRLISGLSHGEGSIMSEADGARLSYRLIAVTSATLDLGLIPLFPEGDDSALHFDVAIDGAAPHRIDVPRQAEGGGWAQGVLDNLLTVSTGLTLSPGPHDIVITARGTGLALDRLTLRPAPSSTAH